jgi:adenylosuccinate lyase
MVGRAARLVSGLVVRPQRLARNLALSGGLWASEKVMLKLVEAGMARRAAYELVQRHALAQATDNAEQDGSAVASDPNRPPFLARLLADSAVTSRLSESTLGACFDLALHLRHVPAIIERALATT